MNELKDIGGKAQNLLKLKELGFNVPDFLIITPDEIENDEILNAKLKDLESKDITYAVRSSGINEDSKDKSYAGIFKTEIDVLKKDLIPSIKRIYLATDDAKQYIENIKDQKVTVIVQKYIKAKYFGICFTKLKNNLVINIHEGIGEDLVSGKVSGEEINILRETFTYIHKPKLLLNYSRLIRVFLKIEKDFGGPQDIEFCIDEDDNFWILQTRPVTVVF